VLGQLVITSTDAVAVHHNSLLVVLPHVAPRTAWQGTTCEGMWQHVVSAIVCNKCVTCTMYQCAGQVALMLFCHPCQIMVKNLTAVHQVVMTSAAKQQAIKPPH
jgi:hypothetical protein